MLRIFPVALFLLGACSASFAAVDSSLLALAPASSQVVAGVNVDGSLSSAFGQFLLRQLSSHDDSFQQLVEQTGFDPRRDLQSILLTAAPSQNSKAHGRFAVLARGNFDQNRIKAAAQKQGSVVQHFQGVDLLVGREGNEQTVFAFPDVDLAVMGDLLSVKQVIRNRANPANLDPALQDQISKIEANDAWFASILPPPSFTADVDPDLKKSMDHAQVLRSIIRSSGGIEFGSTSDIVFNAETRSAQDATALADVIRFMTSMVQMQRGKDGRIALLGPALDSMKLEVAGSSVHMAVHLPESVLEQLANTQEKPARSTR
jgi:hypothetical protein